MENEIKCVVCGGSGFQEERFKGYRRYKCSVCDGSKQVDNPFPEVAAESEEKNNDA